MPKKLGRIASVRAKNRLAKKEYNKYFQDAKKGVAQTTRKRESAQRKARATAEAKRKYGMTSAERKTDRRKKFAELSKKMESLGEGFSGMGAGLDMDILTQGTTKTKKKRKTTKKKDEDIYTKYF